MSELVQPLGQRRERQPRAKGEKPLDQAFVARQWDGIEGAHRRRADSSFDLRGRDSQKRVRGLVQGGHHEDRDVDVAYVPQENERGPARMQVGGMVIVCEGTDTRLHGQVERPSQARHFGLGGTIGYGGPGQRPTHLLRSIGESGHHQ